MWWLVSPGNPLKPAKGMAPYEARLASAREQARARRAALVEKAEQLAAVPPEKTQWRTDGQTMKELFETWRTEQKGEGKLDRRSEDELWKRFSHARTAFDRKRRQYFAQLDETQGEAKAVKEKLVKEAEALQGSTDWGPTAQAYKRLMDRWRESGRANRKDDDALWQRFRAAQDTFFAARHAAQAEQDSEFAANLQVKLALLAEAEALLPVRDLAAAKSALRDIQERWESAGKVPRADLDQIERRMRTVEQSVRDADDRRWQSSNPEARARAQSAVDQLESGIADLEATAVADGPGAQGLDAVEGDAAGAPVVAVAAQQRLAGAGQRVHGRRGQQGQPHPVRLAPGQPLDAGDHRHAGLHGDLRVLLREAALAVPRVHRLVLRARPDLRGAAPAHGPARDRGLDAAAQQRRQALVRSRAAGGGRARPGSILGAGVGPGGGWVDLARLVCGHRGAKPTRSAPRAVRA